VLRYAAIVVSASRVTSAHLRATEALSITTDHHEFMCNGHPFMIIGIEICNPVHPRMNKSHPIV